MKLLLGFSKNEGIGRFSVIANWELMFDFGESVTGEYLNSP